MKSRNIIIASLLLGMVFQGVWLSAETVKADSRILKFREGISGLLVDTQDLKRILMNSKGVSKLKPGAYNVGLSLLNAPVFLIAELKVDGEQDTMHLDWNASLKLLDEKHLMIPSVPGYDWSRNRLKTGLPFRLLFFLKKSRSLEIIKLELAGSLRRSLEIPMP